MSDDVPASEYINSLLTGYQFAEKIYSQCVSDVIAAEIRRDEAKKARDELLVRLEYAREKYGGTTSSPSTNTNITPPKEPSRQNSSGRGRRKQPTQHANNIKIVKSKVASDAMEKNSPVDAPQNPTLPDLMEVEEPPVARNQTTPPACLTPTTTPQHPSKTTIANSMISNDFMGKNLPIEVPKSPSMPEQPNGDASRVALTPTRTPQRLSKIKIANSMIASESMEKIMLAEDAKTTVETEQEQVEASSGTFPAIPSTSSDILLSPTAGTKKAPRLFLSPSQLSPKKRSSRYVTLAPIENTKLVLGIAPGRTREWFENNFDCDSCGLVKSFYKAAFGTKTNEKTQKVTVKTVVLNDEWTDFVTDTSQIQELYIGRTNSDKDGKPNPRDKAAEALVNPPQQGPIALFFAPRKSQDTGLVFYGGHWKVIDGKMLNPPRVVKGQTRQCLVKFAFVGVDRLILEALNNGPG